MTTRRVVRERIDPRLTAALFANYRTPADAVLELVDNAIDSRLAGMPLAIDLAVRPGSLVLEVTGGTGMGPAAIERDYLRWGASPKRGGERIGRYGQGGKAAIGHLGNRFEIVASPAGDAHAYGFEDLAYRERSRLRTYELHQRRKPVDQGLGYVRIEVGGIDRKLDPRRLAERLAEAYRPLLDAGAIGIAVNRAPLKARPWETSDRHDLAVRAGGRLVRGWWGLLPDPPPPGAPDPGRPPLPPGPARGSAGVVRPPDAGGPRRPQSPGRRGGAAPRAGHDEQGGRRSRQPRMGSGGGAAPRAPLPDRPPADPRADVGGHAGGDPHGRPGAADPGQGAAAARGRAAVRVGRPRRWRGTGRAAGPRGGPGTKRGAAARGRRGAGRIRGGRRCRDRARGRCRRPGARDPAPAVTARDGDPFATRDR